MHKLLLITFVIAITLGAGFSHGVTYNNADDDWIRVEACRISFLLPRNLKRTSSEGVDSCVAEFEDGKMTLYIDYGWYGSPGDNTGGLQLKKESITVDGKMGQLVTYIDDSLYARKNPLQKYVAHMYVVVKPADADSVMTTSLMMNVRGDSEKKQEIARRIFGSVQFQSPHAEQAQNKDIVLVGTVTEIYPVAGLLKRWAVSVHVDRVVSGEFSGTTFTFTIHSPSLAGLQVGRAYVINARWADKGYVVDESSLTEMHTRAKPSR